MVDCDCIADSWGCDKCFEEQPNVIISELATGVEVDTELNNDNGEDCTCVNCMCGKMKCWICGKGEVPLDYEPCILHGECKANLKGCNNTTIEDVQSNGEWKRIYIGPFESCDIVGTVCHHCKNHPDFVEVFVNGLK